MQKRILREIDPEILQKMATAIRRNKLGLITVLSHELVQELQDGKIAELDLDDGGVLVLIPQSLVDKFFPPDQQKENGNGSSSKRRR